MGLTITFIGVTFSYFCLFFVFYLDITNNDCSILCTKFGSIKHESVYHSSAPLLKIRDILIKLLDGNYRGAFYPAHAL